MCPSGKSPVNACMQPNLPNSGGKTVGFIKVGVECHHLVSVGYKDCCSHGDVPMLCSTMEDVVS